MKVPFDRQKRDDVSSSVPDFSIFFASREMRNEIIFLENSQEIKKILQKFIFLE